MFDIRNLPAYLREKVVVETLRVVPHDLNDAVVERISYSITVKQGQAVTWFHTENLINGEGEMLFRDLERIARLIRQGAA